MPAVLLNRSSQIYPESERLLVTLIPFQPLSRKVFIVLLLVFPQLFFISTALHAREPFSGLDGNDEGVIDFFIGDRTWISKGNNRWSIADQDGSPNILSELEYLNLESIVTEIYGGIKSGRGMLSAGYGFGSMHNGKAIDSDYYLNDRKGLFSRSTASADGKTWNDLWYINIEYSYKLFMGEVSNKKKSASFDLLSGYLHWAEKVTATNGVQEVPPLGNFSNLNSTYEFKWGMFFIGAQGVLPIYEGLYLKARGAYMPSTTYEGIGVWNLRSDFQQNPSFEQKAYGGYGYQLDSALGYALTDSLEIEAGYKYWDVRSGSGDDITFFSDGTAAITKFNGAISIRQGAEIKINYLF